MKAFDYEPTFKKTTLDNGVRVITEHHPYTRATSFGFYIDLGTRDEPDDIVGAAHFLEHLLFKGTSHRTAYQIVSELEAVGGEINAYTSREYTCYHGATLREHSGIGLDVLGDLICNANLDEKELEKEREVILQEIDMSKDSLEEYIFDLYFEESFSGHNLGRPILGTPESLKRINSTNIRNFFNERYHGQDLIVAISGHVDHDKAVQELAQLNDIKRPVAQIEARKEPVVQPFRRYLERSAEQVHFIAGFPSTSFRSKFRFEAYILNAVLGGGMTSHLYQKIREEQALAYNVYSYLHSYTDSGLLMTYAGTAKENLEKVVTAVAAEYNHLKKNGISSKEVEYYRRQVMGQILLGADDIENRMNSIAVNEMVFGRYRPVDEVVAEIEAVSEESIKEFISKSFDYEKLGIILLGDIDSESEKIITNSFG